MCKKLYILSLFLAAFVFTANAQNISINDNGTAPDNSAMLDVSSVSKGLLTPRMTLIQRTAILLPAKGLIIYQTDNTEGFYVNLGSTVIPNWQRLTTTNVNIDNISDADGDTKVVVEQNADDDTLRFFSNGAQSITLTPSGNVGIGTTTPSQKLETYISGNDGVQVTGNNTGDARFTISNGGGFHYLFDDQSDANNLVLQSATSTKFYTSGANERMRIESGGNIGIGTTTPNALLHLSKSVGTSTNDGAFIDIQNSTGVANSLAGIRFKANSSTTNIRYQGAIFHRWTGSKFQLNFAVRDNSTTDVVDTDDIRMTITEDGNVGIGTTSPDSLLDVVGGAEIDGLSINANYSFPTDAPSANEILKYDGIDLVWDTESGGSSPWVTTGTDINYIAGKVGIGHATSGTYPLEVSSDALGAIAVNNYRNSGFSAANLFLQRARGTQASPAEVESGDAIGAVSFYGHNGTFFSRAAFIQATATQDFSLGRGSKIEFYTTPNSSGTQFLRLTLDQDGDFITGHIKPVVNDFYDLGTSSLRWDDVHATNGTIQTSDRRLKKNITPLNYGLTELMKLKAVHYQWKENNSNAKKIGFIAQEVLPLIPEVVNVGDDSLKTLGMRYGDMVPLLVKSIQEQQSIIGNLQVQLEKLEKEVERLKTNIKK